MYVSVILSQHQTVPHYIHNSGISQAICYILLTVHHVMILGKWPTWRTILFYVFIYIFNSTCFDHIVLIIRRDKLCQYNLW